MFEILSFFPKNISEILKENIEKNYSNLEEIRIRAYKPIILKFVNNETIVPYEIKRRRNNKNFANYMW